LTAVLAVGPEQRAILGNIPVAAVALPDLTTLGVLEILCDLAADRGTNGSRNRGAQVAKRRGWRGNDEPVERPFLKRVRQHRPIAAQIPLEFAVRVGMSFNRIG
jgi:hypothetical protein